MNLLIWSVVVYSSGSEMNLDDVFPILVEGSQATDGTTFGQSITDPCLGWADTEKLILDTADRA